VSVPNKDNLRDPRQLLALGFGSGLAPVAPGTFGTLVGVLIYLPLSQLPLVWYLAALLVVVLIGIPVCGHTARALGTHDHGSIVWDEIAGMLVTMIGAPAGWPWLVGGFLLFRLFDIWKPWPIRLLDREVGGGLGIMLDDLLAGVYALLVLQLAGRLLS